MLHSQYASHDAETLPVKHDYRRCSAVWTAPDRILTQKVPPSQRHQLVSVTQRPTSRGSPRPLALLSVWTGPHGTSVCRLAADDVTMTRRRPGGFGAPQERYRDGRERGGMPVTRRRPGSYGVSEVRLSGHTGQRRAISDDPRCDLSDNPRCDLSDDPRMTCQTNHGMTCQTNHR